MDVFRQDLLFALRVLRRDRAYAAAVILTLAICLGANTAIFTVVRSVLQRPLPYPESSRLVSSFDGFPGAGVERAGTSVPNYMDRRAMTDIFSSVALYQWWGFKVGQGAGTEQVSSMNVTPSFFQVARGEGRARPAAQRGRRARPASTRWRSLSHAFAAKQPGGVDGVVGRTVRLNDELYQVVGVLPESFTFLSPEVRVFTPLAFTPEELAEDRRWSQNHEMIARLAPGASIERAQSKLDAQNVRYVEQAGALAEPLRNVGYNTKLQLARGRPRAQRALRAADAVGRRAVRRPHRRGQHRQPVAGARQRPHEGAGDAQRDRRRRAAHRQAADHRGDAADADRRRPGHRPRLPQPQRHRVDRLHRPAPRARDQPRRRRAGGDAGAGGPARDRRRRRPGAAARPRQLEQRAARRGPLGHGRPHLEGGPPLARGRAGRARLRPADRRRPAAGQLPAPARRRSRASSPRTS